jgi:hypothetical protein
MRFGDNEIIRRNADVMIAGDRRPPCRWALVGPAGRALSTGTTICAASSFDKDRDASCRRRLGVLILKNTGLEMRGRARRRAGG